MDKTVYLDNNASTRVDDEVKKAMNPYFSEKYGNPSCLHEMGKMVRQDVEDARKQIADSIGAKYNEIIFTSSGTESNNIALKGLVLANPEKNHIVTTRIEHPSIKKVCKYLKNYHNFKITEVSVDKNGCVNPEAVEKAIRPETLLVSVMTINNEIGSIQSIKEIGQMVKNKHVYFHTDAISAIGLVNIDVNEWKVDLLSMDSHKIYGPKGIGALYIKSSVKRHMRPIILGGEQEFKLHAGTENVPGIIGMAKAYELNAKIDSNKLTDMKKLRDILIQGILNIGNVNINGPWETDRDKRSPNNVNVSFFDIDNGYELLSDLSQKGIYLSAGCACNSKNKNPSAVLIACGRHKGEINGTLRFTLSKHTTKVEIEYVLNILPKIVYELRIKSKLIRQ